MLASGALGAPRGVQANFGFNLPFDREHRLFSKEKGGGAALDIGCYCVQWGTMVFGSSGLEQVASTGNLAPTGMFVNRIRLCNQQLNCSESSTIVRRLFAF